jgi:biotin carboxylase
VVKPVDSGGQRGLFLIENADQLHERLPSTLQYSRVGRAIVERFVPGSELNVMAVVSNGKPHVLTVSDRLRPKGPGFGVGWAHLFPSLLPRATLEHAAKIAREAIIALGLRDGIAFPQLLVTDEGVVVVVEVAARIAAGQMADLVRHGVGIDLLEIAFAQALGEPLEARLLEPRFTRPLAIRLLTASPGVLPTGRLKSISGLDRVRAAPGVIEADLYLQLGETINPVQVDADRRGYIIATGDNPAEALTRADEAAKRLTLEVDP